MDIEDRKKVIVIQQYIVEKFTDTSWAYFGQLTGSSEQMRNHKRLLRSLFNQDDDYPHCVGEVVLKVCQENPQMVDTIIDHYDIDLWYAEAEPKKAARIFKKRALGAPSFWTNGLLRVFISHLAVSKNKATVLKEWLAIWGMSGFVAHEDIEPTMEWMSEIELALGTMDLLAAMVEPGFKESNWTDQEIGYALGRNIEIIPLRVGADPHGFMGKFQGIQSKGRLSSELALDILKICLKKSRLKPKILAGLNISFSRANSSDKVSRIKEVDGLNLLTNDEMKELLERSNLSAREKIDLKIPIEKYKAFPSDRKADLIEDDLPF